MSEHAPAEGAGKDDSFAVLKALAEASATILALTFVGGIVAIVGAASSACSSGQSPRKEERGSPADSGESRSAAKNRAIVLVHGIHGSAVDTWQADNGMNWVDRVKSDPEFKDADVFNPAYRTPYTGNKNDAAEIAKALGEGLSDVFRPTIRWYSSVTASVEAPTVKRCWWRTEC